MSSREAALPLTVAVVAGALLWFAASFTMGVREPWDRPAYWSVVYPVALVGCAALGFAFPRRAWLWALMLFQGQFVAMVLRNGELGGLWPLGMMLFVVVALPGGLLAAIGARIRANRYPHTGRKP